MLDEWLGKLVDLPKSEKEIDKWMKRQAGRCLERGHDDVAEWCEKGLCDSFERREYLGEEAKGIYVEMIRASEKI